MKNRAYLLGEGLLIKINLGEGLGGLGGFGAPFLYI